MTLTVPKDTLQSKGEAAIVAALEQAEGRVARAAGILGVGRTTLIKALETWAAHLAPAAQALRAETGYTFGRPGVMEREIPRDRFVDAWTRHEQRIAGVARELEVDRYTVRRLACLYDVPGAPPMARRPRRKMEASDA